MDSLGGLAWGLEAPRATEAALRQRFPYKFQGACKVAARGIVADVQRAWVAYRAGAAAALFDVVRYHQDVALRLPDDVAAELFRLSVLALDGAGVPVPRGQRSPLTVHRNYIMRRLRHAAVRQVLDIHAAQREDDDPSTGAIASGADPARYAEWRRQRPEVTGQVGDAASMAWEWAAEAARLVGVVPESVSAESYETAYREVQSFLDRGGAWPGPYYVPSVETVELLGWTFLAPHHGVLLGSDAPALLVA